MSVFNKVIPAKSCKISVTYNVDQEADPVEIIIYDDIGVDPWTGEGFTAKDFTAALNEIQPKSRTLHTRINSRGGDVNEGKAIRSQLEDWPGRIVNMIDGVAASTASWMIPADETHARDASQIFIHKSWAVVAGNSDDMKKAVSMLDLTDHQIADIYSRQTGKPAAEMLDLMAKETLLSGKQALALGFVDKIIGGDAVHNFADGELATMRRHLAALNSLRISAPPARGEPGKQNQKPKDQMKEKLIALLNMLGITIPDNATEDQLIELVNSTRDTNTPPAAPPSNDLIQLKNELELIKKRAEGERVDRVTRALDQLVIDNKLTVEESKDWLPKCIADDTLLASLNKREPVFPGGAPVIPAFLAVGNSTIDKFRSLKPGAERNEWMLEHFTGLKNTLRQFSPRNNTFESALVTAFQANAVVTVMQNKLAMLNLFSRDFGLDPMKPLAVIQVKKATVGSTGQTDATDFTSGDSTISNIAVTPHVKSVTWNVTNAELNSGFKLSDLAEINAMAMANLISDVVTALMTTANYGTALAIGSAANFDLDGTSPILAVAKNYRQKNLILDGGHLAFIQPKSTDTINWRTSGGLGFDRIAENNRWTSAATNAAGFVCGPDSIGVAAGQGEPLPGTQFDEIQTLQLTNGLPVRMATWFDPNTRKTYTCLDNVFGAAAGDTTQAEVLVTS